MQRCHPSPKASEGCNEYYSEFAASDWSVPDSSVLARPLADNTRQEAKVLIGRMERLQELHRVTILDNGERQRRWYYTQNKQQNKWWKQEQLMDALDKSGEMKKSILSFVMGCNQLQALCDTSSVSLGKD